VAAAEALAVHLVDEVADDPARALELAGPEVPIGKKSSGSSWRHAARCRQSSMRSHLRSKSSRLRMSCS
jgi:hypothetical protein